MSSKATLPSSISLEVLIEKIRRHGIVRRLVRRGTQFVHRAKVRGRVLGVEPRVMYTYEVTSSSSCGAVGHTNARWTSAVPIGSEFRSMGGEAGRGADLGLSPAAYPELAIAALTTHRGGRKKRRSGRGYGLLVRDLVDLLRIYSPQFRLRAFCGAVSWPRPTKLAAFIGSQASRRPEKLPAGKSSHDEICP